LNKLEQAKQEMASIEAYEGLKVVWFLRFCFSILMVFIITYFVIITQFQTLATVEIVVAVVFISILLLEMYYITLFFKQRKKSLLPLTVFSVLWVANFPVGTALSCYHFYKVNKLNFNA